MSTSSLPPLDRLRQYTVLAVHPPTPHGVLHGLGKTAVGVEYLSAFAPDLDLSWRVDLAFGSTVAAGSFRGPTTAAELSIPFAPPRYGCYAVSVTATGGEQVVCSAAALIAVTPDGDPLPATFGDPGGFGEIDLIAWMRLGRVRLNTNDGPDRLAARIAFAKAKGVKYIIQFVRPADFSPPNVTAYARRFPGEIWEGPNEPDITSAAYVNGVLAPGFKALKAADPTATLIGPTAVSVTAASLAAFVALGGLRYVDQFATHDYQGNEDDEPLAWRAAFGTEVADALRAGGRPSLPVWVTERDFAGIYGGMLVWTAQAVYLIWHTNMLDALGVPLDRDLYYYAADMGYDAVPSWLFGRQGLMPGGLAMRTRAGVLGSKPFVRTLDFGVTLNHAVVGLVHADAAGQVVTLFNTGTVATPIALHLGTTDPMTVTDAFGNATTLSTSDGKVTLSVATMPTYMTLPAGAAVSVAMPPWPTANLLAGAQVTSTARSIAGSADLSTLATDAPLRSPLGDGGGPAAVWAGEGSRLPQVVTFTAAQPVTATRAIIWGTYADNAYCCLLAYDLQAMVDGRWTTVDRYDAGVAPAWHGKTPYRSTDLPNELIQSYPATCFGLHTFPPVTASRWRLNVAAVSYGLHTDKGCHDYGATVQRSAPPLIHLRKAWLFA